MAAEVYLSIQVGNENFESFNKSMPDGTIIGNLFLAEKVAMLQENRVKEDVSSILKKIRFINTVLFTYNKEILYEKCMGVRAVYGKI